VVLRVRDDSLGRGALFWQAQNDAYEVHGYSARDDSAPPASLRPNLQRQWIGLWGKRHIRNTSGTSLTGAAAAVPSVRFYSRIPADGAAPADLELDPSYHPGRPRLSLGADLARLKVPSRRPRRTP
jgi:serine/threonine-protein kinase